MVPPFYSAFISALLITRYSIIHYTPSPLLRRDFDIRRFITFLFRKNWTPPTPKTGLLMRSVFRIGSLQPQSHVERQGQKKMGNGPEHPPNI